MRDVFDIDDEIAQGIVGKLKVHLDAKAGLRLMKRYTESPEVHSLDLRAILHLSHLCTSLAEMEKAREYLGQVVAAEPVMRQPGYNLPITTSRAVLWVGHNQRSDSLGQRCRVTSGAGGS